MIAEETWSSYRAWLLGTDHSPSTARKALRYLRWFESEFHIGLEGLRLQDAIAFVGAHRDLARKPQTLNNWVRELNLWSRYRGLGWHLQYFRVYGRPEIRVPTRKDVSALLRLTWSDRSTDARNRAILYVLVDGAVRRDELVHLQLADLIPPPKGPGLWIRAGKGQKERAVWISARTWTSLRAYVDAYRTRSHASALFTTPRGAISYQYLGKVVNESGRRVGLTWLTPHKLRHFAADDLLDHGTPVSAIMDQLGHSSLATTQIYLSRRSAARTSHRELRAAAERRFQ